MMTIGENPGTDPMLEIRKAGDLVRGVQEHLALAHQALRALGPQLVAALTEQAIVDALKADPGMAGRVIVEVAQTMQHGRQEIGRSAADKLGSHPTTAAHCLQSLAVALAAASYRG
jgi:hypothetical protein